MEVITIDDLSSRMCVPNKTENANLNVFDTITGINESNIFHVSVNANFMVENVIQIKSGIMINVDMSVKNQ